MSEIRDRADRLLHNGDFWRWVGAVLVVIGFWFLLKNDQYHGCLRGTADRNANALSWDYAVIARRDAWAKETPGEPHDQRALLLAADGGNVNARAAVQYQRSAADLRTRTRPTEEGRAKLCRVFVSYWPWQ